MQMRNGRSRKWIMVAENKRGASLETTTNKTKAKQKDGQDSAFHSFNGECNFVLFILVCFLLLLLLLLLLLSNRIALLVL